MSDLMYNKVILKKYFFLLNIIHVVLSIAIQYNSIQFVITNTNTNTNTN